MLSLIPLLMLSMLALLVGSLAGILLRNQGWGIASLKGLMASFLGGLLLFHLLPEAYALLGSKSLLLMLAGFLFMVLPERLGHPEGHGGHGHGQQGRFFTAEMLWAGLIIHQVTDGIGLALAAKGNTDWHLALVVLAHRIPVAAVVIWLFYRDNRKKQAWLRVAGMAVATLVGALFYRGLEPLLSSTAINMFYAFIAGSFLHLLTHDFLDHHAHLDRDRRCEFFAFVLGIGLFLMVETGINDHEHQVTPPAQTVVADNEHASHDAHQEEDGIVLADGAFVFANPFLASLLVLIRETSPYLLLGLIISGLLHVYMPSSPISWLRRGSPTTQSLKGMAFGLPLPICSCGVLPLFLSLSRKGVPPACLVAFLIATPELGVDSFLLSVKLLGWKFSVVRLLIAMVLPVVIALIAVRFLSGNPVQAEQEKSCCKKSAGEKKGEGQTPAKAWWRFAFVDLVDDIFPFVFFGLVVAALAQVLWPSTRFGELVGQWDVLMLGALGIPFYVCASASVPFALILLQQGFSVGAVVVFLFAGPATNVATVLTVNKAFGPKSGLKLATTCFLVAVATGFLINGLYTPEDLGLIELHEHGWTLINAISVVAISVLGIVGLYRSGPLHWISTVLGLIPGVINHPPPPSEQESCH